MKISTAKKIYFTLGIVFIFLCWHIASVLLSNSIALPTIKETGLALGDLLSSKDTYFIILRTIGKLSLVIALSLIVSVILVGFSSLFWRFSEFINPSVSLFKTLPVAVVIIFLLVILGSNKAPFVITMLVIIPIMYEAIYSGIKGIDKTLLEEVKMFSNTNLFVLKKIYLPLSIPHATLAVLQSIGLGLKVMIMAELIAQTRNSIGYEMAWYKSALAMEYVFGWALVMVFFVIIVEILIKKAKVAIIK